jgi:transposase InsO family protein
MEVSRSAYHAYRRGKSYLPSAKKVAVRSRVSEVFYAHRRRYGTRRIAAQLKDEGISAGRFAVRTQMGRLNLQAIAPRRFRPQTTDSRHSTQASPNLLLAAENAPQEPGQVIVGDITYLPTRVGRWSYLASWQDKFSKRIVGWAVAETMTEELVIKALGKALADGAIKAGTIIHSDRGSQYVSKTFRALLADHGCRQSMSRRGNCWDNAQAESLFSRYKAELLEDGMFEDVRQARSETFSYIEGYYNRVRRHSALGYKSPAEFERDFNQQKKGSSSESFVCGKT